MHTLQGLIMRSTPEHRLIRCPEPMTPAVLHLLLTTDGIIVCAVPSEHSTANEPLAHETYQQVVITGKENLFGYKTTPSVIRYFCKTCANRVYGAKLDDDGNEKQMVRLHLMAFVSAPCGHHHRLLTSCL